MQWALLAVIIVALFLLSGRYPRVAFGILGVLVVATLGLILLTEDDASLNRERIAPADIAVESISGTPAYGGSHRLTGRVKNNHASAELKELALSIIMQDCTDAGCEVVGQARERVNLRVPAGQVRDFNVTVYLGEPLISGTIDWKFTVTDTRS